MALATPEAWFRLLRRKSRWRGVSRLASVVLSVGASLCVFVVTLPERVLLAGLLHAKFGADARFEHEPGVVAILGYYRSGTTHLHNLLSCDRRMVTPRWVQALAPHGLFASWTALSWILTPFLGNKRPQDGVGFGTSWPAEDDFAMCNWGLASSLPGRLIYPSQWDHYQRWQYMEELTPAELSRWRRLMASFCWKVTALKRRRMLLLKSPSHSSRVAELRRLFDDRIRFIVIERDREEIIASHVFMSQRLERFLLEPALDEDDLRRLIEEDFDRCTTAMRTQLDQVPASRVATIQFDDLRVDAVGEIRRAYADVGLEWDQPLERRVVSYLEREGAYSPRHSKPIASNVGQGARISPVRRAAAIMVAILVAVAYLAVWMVVAQRDDARWDVAAWPLGFAIGLITVRVSGAGDRWLGLAAALVCMAALGAAQYMLPEVVYGWVEEHRWKTIRSSFNGPRVATWVVLGVLTAFRCASRRHIRPPG